MWSTGEGTGKPLQYSCLENSMNSMKRQKDRTLKDELPRSIGAQNATGDQWRNNSRKNGGMEPKQKQYPVVDVTGDRSKVRCCKEQYCIGTWQVRSMNQAYWKWSTHGHHQIVNTEIRLIIFFAAKDREALYSQQKQDRELIVAQIMNSFLPNSHLN